MPSTASASEPTRLSITVPASSAPGDANPSRDGRLGGTMGPRAQGRGEQLGGRGHEGERMAEIRRGRFTAEIDGDFVVLLIGPRVNKPWRLLQVARDLGEPRRGMKAMLERARAASREGAARLPHGLPGDRPVLAQLRAPGGLRPRPRRPAPAHLAGLLPPPARRAHRHLARDLPGPGRASTRRSTTTPRSPGWPPRAGRSPWPSTVAPGPAWEPRPAPELRARSGSRGRAR